MRKIVTIAVLLITMGSVGLVVSILDIDKTNKPGAMAVLICDP